MLNNNFSLTGHFTAENMNTILADVEYKAKNDTGDKEFEKALADIQNGKQAQYQGNAYNSVEELMMDFPMKFEIIHSDEDVELDNLEYIAQLP